MNSLKFCTILFIIFQATATSGQFYGKVNLDEISCEAHLDTLINKEVYSVTEEMPEPEGGMTNLYQKISKSVTFSHKRFERMGIELDKIFVGFVVDVDGSVIGKRIIRNVEGTNIAEQMLAIIADSPWTPGY